MNIDELKNQLKNSINEISVYDFNSYTSIELYYKIANKVNEIIKELERHEILVSDEIIKQNNALQEMFDSGLHNEVVNKINDMVNDGTMDSIINHNIFNEINSQIKEKATKKEVDIERKRIDNFTSLPEGSTTGDAELIDARVGADGVNYNNLGNSIRTQVNNIKNQIETLKGVIIPSTWLDIPEAIRNFRNPDYTVEGGFDWFKISINLNKEGNGGIDFPLSEDIHNISFKVTQYNFGFNLGICFYKGDTFKKGYTAPSGGDVSSEVSSKEVSLNIDWEYVKAQFLTGDYDNIRFIVWNSSNAIEGGYNILEDIKINGVSLSKDYEDRVKALETFKDNPIIPMDNVYRNEYFYLNTSEDMSGLIPWGSKKYTIEGDVIAYSYVEETGNAGMESNPFISRTNFVTIEGEVLDLNYIEGTTGSLGAHIKGKTLDGSTTYIPMFVIDTEGRFKGTVDLNNLAVYRDLDLTQPITGLISNSGKVSAKIKDLKVYEDVFHDTDLVGSDLVETCINFDRAITQLKLSNENQSNDASLVSPNGNKFRLQISDEGVISASPVIPRKTLFIGNSLLSGFRSFGMCASNNQEDYYAYVTQYILKENPQAEFTKKPASTFEEISNPSEVATWINSNIKTLPNDYDLVLIQLGDNVNTDEKNEVFKTSCRTLLSEVRRYMPNALVCWVGAWYTNATKQENMSKSCLATGSKFIDITDLAVVENKGKVGDLITYPDGRVEAITSTGVASHPNSKGMKAIADRIISTIF